MAEFYQLVADMTILYGDNDHVVLELEGMQLVVHALPPGVPRDETIVTPPTVREDSYLKLCFPVTSIAAARRQAESLGGMIKPAANEWEARGFRACDGHDPEGNVIQVRESAP